MSPRDSVDVGHMLDMARKAVAKTAGVRREVYERDENLRLALTHLVQVIGAARLVASLEKFAARRRQPSWAAAWSTGYSAVYLRIWHLSKEAQDHAAHR